MTRAELEDGDSGVARHARVVANATDPFDTPKRVIVRKVVNPIDGLSHSKSITDRRTSFANNFRTYKGTHRVDQPPGADRRPFEEAMPWLRRDAQTSSWFSHYPACGQAGHTASL